MMFFIWIDLFVHEIVNLGALLPVKLHQVQFTNTETNTNQTVFIVNETAVPNQSNRKLVGMLEQVSLDRIHFH